jgi:hypothetical protein
VFNQEDQDIHRDALQLERTTAAAQLVSAQVKLNVVAQLEYVLGFCGL